MFGYATDETEECMPLTIVLAHKLNAKMSELRRNGTVSWLRPDSKTQVGHKYSSLIVNVNKSLTFPVLSVNWTFKLVVSTLFKVQPVTCSSVDGTVIVTTC